MTVLLVLVAFVAGYVLGSYPSAFPKASAALAAVAAFGVAAWEKLAPMVGW